MLNQRSTGEGRTLNAQRSTFIVQVNSANTLERWALKAERWTFALLAALAFAAVSGCGDSHPSQPPGAPSELIAASQALANKQPELVISDSRAFLDKQSTGPLAAQALYFEGRGEEDLIPTNAADRQRNLSEARSCYLLALQQNPPQALEADIYTSLSNVSFFQDDYPNCIQYATVAMSMTNLPKVQSYLLFRMGMSEQRLGRFTDADQTFHQVEQRYPNTELAQAAKEHEGLRNFYVQVATYGKQQDADHATEMLSKNGVVVSQRTDAAGHVIIDDGPFATFTQAKNVRDSLVKDFPNALIVP